MICITAVIRTQINEPLGRGFEVVDGLFLTNDKELIRRKIPQHARMSMGQEYAHLLDMGLAAYWETDEEHELAKERNDIRMLTFWLYTVRAFYQALWLVKDNASINEMGFGIYVHPVHKQPACCSNLIASAVSTADAGTPTTTFSLAELRQARDYFQNFTLPAVLHDYLKDMEQPGSLPPIINRFASAKGRTRMTRFNYFLSSARGMGDVDGKISMYMTCLEILFSTTASELTHKLAERVALFLESEPAKRKALFNTIKAAYSVRSKIVHGDEIDASEKIVGLSRQIDDIVRRVYLRIIADQDLQDLFDKDKSAVEDYMINLTLGLPPATPNHTEPTTP
jgi:hypothetical protein